MPFPHGEQRGYSRGCRCDSCRTAHAAYVRQRREVARFLPDKQIPHGSTNGYVNYRCHCTPCTEAHRLRVRAYRANRRAT